MRELENIRSFLTGNALTLVLDLLFSVVFIGVMLLYSVKLTLIVLAALPLYVGLSLAVVPVLRGRLDEKFARGAENQALLVETVTGIQTVKAGALEPAIARRWDEQLAAYVSAGFRTQTLATWAHEAVNLIGKLVNAATLWFGARAVMNYGATSNDIYRFGRGDGSDSLYDVGGNDRIELGAGLSGADVGFSRSGNNLVISLLGGVDMLTVSNWYGSTANQIEEIRLADGSAVLASQLQALTSAMAQFSAYASGGEPSGAGAMGYQLRPDMMLAASAL